MLHGCPEFHLAILTLPPLLLRTGTMWVSALDIYQISWCLRLSPMSTSEDQQQSSQITEFTHHDTEAKS